MPPLLPQPSTDCSAHQVVWGPHVDPLFSSQHCAAPVAEVPAQEDCAIEITFWQTVIAKKLSPVQAWLVHLCSAVFQPCFASRPPLTHAARLQTL